jgi:uncharacterized protein (DUF2147 family)
LAARANGHNWFMPFMEPNPRKSLGKGRQTWLNRPAAVISRVDSDLRRLNERLKRMTFGTGLKRFLARLTMALPLLACGATMPLAQTDQAAPVPTSPLEGVWRTQLLSEVTIGPCPEGFCGALSHIVVPEGLLSGAEADAAAAMSPDQFFDYRNEDPALRNRPMLGLQILTLWQGKEPHIFDGEVYNPEDGKTYSGYIELIGPDTLRLNGCVLFNVVCRGEDWTRVPAAELEARAAEAADVAAPVQ